VGSANERAVRLETIVPQLFLEREESQCSRRRQRPPFHLPVTHRRQVGEPTTRHGGQCIIEPRQHDFTGVHHRAHRREESVQPAVVVDPFARPRPSSEFLAVVREHGELFSLGTEEAQVCHRVFRRLERNQVAEAFVDREKRQRLSVVFSAERGM
jgi:hypothetical protein